MNQVAERYVKLVLKVGQHDADYVDAYYGDASWKPAGAPASYDVLAAQARSIKADLSALKPAADGAGADELILLRYEYLDRQLDAVAARLEMLQGKKFSFDEESRRLYDAEAPHKAEAEFTAVLDQLARLLPGTGSLADRYAAFRTHFLIRRIASTRCSGPPSTNAARARCGTCPCLPASSSRWST